MFKLIKLYCNDAFRKKHHVHICQHSAVAGLECRELALAEDVAHYLEPDSRDIMHALGQIAKNMHVKNDLRAEIT